MAVWVLIPDKVDDASTDAQRFGVFGTTLVTFFLAEMGDKTQIATVALAARFHDLVSVVAGTTLGMLIADVPAVFFVDPNYREMKTLLDCDGVEEEAKLEAVVRAESPEFTDFLNFFELVAYLDNIETITRDDTEALLGYYLNRLHDKGCVWSYIRKTSNGFENLRKLLTERETQ